VSFYAKSTVNGDKIVSHFYPNLDGNKGDGMTYTTLTTSWVKYSISWLRQTNDAVNLIVCRLISGSGTGTVSLCGVKFEEGNKATAWSPSINDIQFQINTLNSFIDQPVTIRSNPIFNSITLNDGLSQIVIEQSKGTGYIEVGNSAWTASAPLQICGYSGNNLNSLTIKSLSTTITGGLLIANNGFSSTTGTFSDLLQANNGLTVTGNITGVTSLVATNVQISNAVYFNGTNNYFNFTNGAIYTNGNLTINGALITNSGLQIHDNDLNATVTAINSGYGDQSVNIDGNGS
jgi:hypothetical protein